MNVNHLYSGNPLTSTSANSEKPDEMQHNDAFHQGSTLLERVKKILRKKKTIFVSNYNLTPLDMYNGLFFFVLLL